jgi:lipase chaperone LimK
LAPSLQDSDIDGEIEMDSLGNLIATRGLRRRFDYFLVQMGEKDLPAIRRDLASSLSSSQRRDVLLMFERYVDYLEKMATITTSDATQRLAQLHQLREQTLGAEIAAAFFAEEEAADAEALRRGKTTETTGLLSEFHAHQNTAQGLSDQDLERERAALFGPEAAARLKALDRARASWKARLDTFEAEVRALEKDASLGATERSAKIDQLRAQHFTPQEQLRLHTVAVPDGR